MMLTLRRSFCSHRGPRSISFSTWNKSFQRKTKSDSCYERFRVPEGLMESCDLKNGMRLVCEYKPSCVTTVGCFLPAGSMYEMPEERGAALFMEHLIFRRTRCRKQEQLELELEKIGGKLAALATRDIFLFYGTSPSCDTEKIVELLADVVLNGITCDEDVIKERFVILRELAEMETDYEGVVMDYLQDIAYQGTELSKSIYPESCIIKNLCAEHVNNFRERLFQPCFMTMVSTGGTSLCEIQRMASKYFIGVEQDSEPIPGDCRMKYFASGSPFRYSGSELRLRDDDEKFACVAVAIEGPGYAKCQDHCTLTVAKEIMGSWDMSYGGGSNNAPYLAVEAFKTHLCYSYKSFNFGWGCTGLWGCYFICHKYNLDDMMLLIQSEWKRLCTTITKKEVERAVNQCRTQELTRITNSVDRFFDISLCLFRHGRYESLTDRLAKYENVSVDMIRNVANEYIYDRCPAVVATGPIENLPDYWQIRAAMHSLHH
ncbi:cytochrome b-c1 complex subunit 1, mitochondrial isoform X1 [Cephus cinctus]|uniref:Cytochrome b-c1 complex subunit 1, mitochondrial isoform X1 n=2 Tax=Cephus cinctus TaxID=211228 RepID=A0AAJ7RT69_CEPCN|nr:cytochrome b-c1 complex subunit 1, mitochondrial isoform X1 [Cephus cinctus]